MTPASPPEPHDAAAFAALYRRTARVAWNVLGRAGIVRKAEREELLQDVYVVVHAKLPSRDPAVPDPPWVAAIAWYVARDYLRLRRVQKEQPVPDPDAVDEPIADAPSPEDVVLRRRAYHAAVDGLAFDDRVVLEMYEIEGFEMPEIARALAIPEGTARTRLRRARQDITAAAARMQARDAHAMSRTALPMILPFGTGAWRSVSGLYDDAPADLADALWPAVSRAIARQAAIGVAASVGMAVAGKGVAFGVGALLGGGVVGAGAIALHLFAAKPAPPPTISRAVDPAPVAAVSELPAASVAQEAPGTSRSAASGAVATTPAASTPPPAAGIDPEELRLYQQALAASRHGDLDAATAALDEHARRFPRGALAKDRDRMRATIAKARAASPAPAAGAPAAGGSRRVFGSED